MPKNIRLRMTRTQMARAERMLQSGHSMAGVSRDMNIPRDAVERQMKAHLAIRKGGSKDSEPPIVPTQPRPQSKASQERSPKSSQTMLSMLCSPWVLPDDSPLHEELEKIEQERAARVEREQARAEAELEDA